METNLICDIDYTRINYSYLSTNAAKPSCGKPMEPQQPFCHHIIAMPYPGRGHINPLINLCKSILTQSPNILVTFVVTEEWLTLLNNSETKPTTTNLVFKTIPNVIPSEHVRAKNFPEFIEAVMNNMEAPFDKLLDNLSCPPTAIVADTYLYWAVKVGNRKNIPVASFWPMSTVVFSVFQHFRLLEIHGHFPIDLSEQEDQRVDYIPGVPSIRLSDLPPVSNDKDSQKQLLQRILQGFSWLSNAQYLLLHSVYELEYEAVDALRSEFSFPIYTIGPCIPYFKPDEVFYQNPRHNEAGYWEWLDSQPNSSVLYISFGSFLSISCAQMDEIAAGLCISGIRFFWVARGESNKLQDMAGDKGLVLPWCDQLRVLSHCSIGGFWTHCGWGSTMEGVFAGLPFLTSSIVMDQIPNSKCIVDDWKIGWRVRAETRSDIADMVIRFMDLQNDEIREMRRRVKELKERCEMAIRKDGSTCSHIARFIRDISK